MLSLTEEQLFSCCASSVFARHVAAAGPHASLDSCLAEARRVWWNEVGVAEWLAAFAAHPRIGDLEGLKKKFGAFADMSKGEQAEAAATATDEVLLELAEWNRKYEARFGHIFIVCASGKGAPEMLAAVKARYSNAPYAELAIAAAEQMKITELRIRGFTLANASASAAAVPAATMSPVERRTGTLLSQLRGGGAAAAPTAAGSGRSPITTHVLDIAVGKPAQGVPVQLQRLAGGGAASDEVGWQLLAGGATNKDGRIADLLPPTHQLAPGFYRICFDTSAYMAACKAAYPDFFADTPFYPRAVVYFHIAPHMVNEHFHVPLTWSPYGYSTYRGS